MEIFIVDTGRKQVDGRAPSGYTCRLNPTMREERRRESKREAADQEKWTGSRDQETDCSSNKS